LLVYAIFKILSIQREFLQLARAWVVWGKGKKNRNCRRKNWPSKRGRGGRCGGNSASPEQKIEAAPPPEKNFWRRARIRNRKEYFAWRRAVASGDGAASLVPFKIGSSEVYNYSTKCNLFGIDCSARRVRRAPQGKIRFCFRRKIPEFAPITI